MGELEITVSETRLDGIKAASVKVADTGGAFNRRSSIIYSIHFTLQKKREPDWGFP